MAKKIPNLAGLAHLAHLNTRPRRSRNGIARFWQWVQKKTDQVLNWFNHHCYHPAIRIALRHRYALVVVFIGILVSVITMPLTPAVST